MKNQNRNKQSKANDYQKLEPKVLLASINFDAATNTVFVGGTNGADEVYVNDHGDNEVSVVLNELYEVFSKDSVQRIQFSGGGGDDLFINFTAINSAAYGQSGDDTLRGGNGVNWIQGGKGNDIIFGGPKNDALRGRSGDDWIHPGSTALEGTDRVFGGEGNDTVAEGDGNTFIFGGNGNDILRAGAGKDSIYGGAGNDRLEGGDGFNRLQGDEGNDTLIGSQSGIDLALYDQSISSFAFDGGGDSFRVISSLNGGTDTVLQTERFFFNGDAFQNEFIQDEASRESFLLLNAMRAELNRTELTAATDLMDYARDWSMEMAEQRRQFHSNELGSLFENGRTALGENVGRIGPASLTAKQAAQQFHDGWRNSPVHFNNMRDAAFSEIGISIFRGADGWYGTHVFAG